MTARNKSRTVTLSAMMIGAIAHSTPTLAAGLGNGDFQTGDFSAWSQDVDGFGAPIAGLNDFTIVEPAPGDFAARIEAAHDRHGFGIPHQHVARLVA